MGIDEKSISEFRKYQKAILSEARVFLENKIEFLQNSSISVNYKLLRLTELITFFELEGEKEIVSELVSLAEALRIKQMLDSKWLYSDL